jgi:hypothetical protein
VKRSDLFLFEEEASTPNRKAYENDVKIARQPERYVRKWQKLAQVYNKQNL